MKTTRDGILGSMTMDQVRDLEDVHSVLTPEGWVIPKWFELLKTSVITQPEDVKWVRSNCEA